jgi:hypothetical protein
MLKKIESHLSEALKMINASIQDGAAKESIVNELGKAMNELNELELDYCELIRSNPDILKFEIVDCSDLACTLGFELEDDQLNELKELIFQNREKINLPETESLLNRIQDRFTHDEVFKNCPEITEFLSQKSKLG